MMAIQPLSSQSHHNPLSIFIVGAGLAGLAASISCALAGHKVTVFEGAKALAEIGAGLQITPNASRLLAKWGILDKCEAVCAEPTRLVVHRYADGKVLAEQTKFNQKIRQKYGAPFIDMHRVDLQRILYDRAIELGVRVELGKRVTGIKHKSERPEVRFEDDGHEECDLIVGADGLWSKCRESLLGKKDSPEPTGDLAFRIVLTADELKGDKDLQDWVRKPECHFWIGPNAHAVGYSVRNGTMFNLVLLYPDDLPQEVSRQTGSVDEMRVLFQGWDPVLTRFLNHVKSVDKWKLMFRSELEMWTNNSRNIVLIGDAVHPMLPYLAQGANSALEDGAVLGKLLANVNLHEQLPQALSTFEKLRKSRSEAISRETFMQREQFHMPDGVGQEARDKLFLSQLGKEENDVKFPSRWTCPRVQPWLYGYDAYETKNTPNPYSDDRKSGS